MIKYPVEDDTHAAPVRLVEQPFERGIPAQYRINLIIVVRVIAMIRGRLKDGAERQCVNAEVCEIVEVFEHAQQIAALEAMRGRRGLPGLQSGRLLDADAGGKTIGKDVNWLRVLGTAEGSQGDELNRPAGGLLVIDVSEYQPFRTTGRTAIEIFLNRRPEGNVIAFLRDPIVAHLTHTSPA